MTLTTSKEMEAAAAAAQCVADVHERLAEYLRAGRRRAEIDGFVARCLDDLHCRSCFRMYKLRGLPPFPSHSCISVNDCIVHGTHTLSNDPLEPGDVVSIDIGVKHRGFIGDAAWTYAIEHAGDTALGLMQCGRESLQRGIAAVQPGVPLLRWAEAVQDFVEGECGFHLVRGLGGHGIGTEMHGPPFISNVTPEPQNGWPDASVLFQPGMLLAVEPMLAIGTPDIKSRRRKWPIFTADGSLSVHYEADILVTEDGCDNLTERMNALPDIVGN